MKSLPVVVPLMLSGCEEDLTESILPRHIVDTDSCFLPSCSGRKHTLSQANVGRSKNHQDVSIMLINHIPELL